MLCLLEGIASADTISYWHVYYNTIKQKEIPETTAKRDIRIWTSAIEPGDVITIRFYTDTPCPTCEYELYVDDTKKNRILTYKGKGVGVGALKEIDVAALLKHTQRTGMGTYRVTLHHDKSDDWLCDLQMK